VSEVMDVNLAIQGRQRPHLETNGRGRANPEPLLPERRTRGPMPGGMVCSAAGPAKGMPIRRRSSENRRANGQKSPDFFVGFYS
jgi:hypothetical protein